jgi:hypothetical protein
MAVDELKVILELVTNYGILPVITIILLIIIMTIISKDVKNKKTSNKTLEDLSVMLGNMLFVQQLQHYMIKILLKNKDLYDQVLAQLRQDAAIQEVNNQKDKSEQTRDFINKMEQIKSDLNAQNEEVDNDV